jgi:MFS family permease
MQLFLISLLSLHAACMQLPSGPLAAITCQHTSAYVSIRQHTSAYVSIRQLAACMQLPAGPLRQYLYFCTRKASGFGRKSRSMLISALTLSTSAGGVCVVWLSVFVWNVNVWFVYLCLCGIAAAGEQQETRRNSCKSCCQRGFEEVKREGDSKKKK